MTLAKLVESDLAARLALTLGHILWQATLAALLAGLVARALAHRSPRARYALYLGAMLAMAACPAITFTLVDPPHTPGTTSTIADDAPIPIIEPHAGAVTGIEQPGIRTDDSATAIAPVRPGRSAGARPNPSPAAPPATAGSEQSATVIPTSSRWQRILREATPWIVSAYLAGVCLMWVRMLAGMGGGYGLRRQSEPIDDESLLEIVATQARRLGMAATPVVAICRRVLVPTVVGVVRPAILVPAAFLTGLTPEQAAAVLAHELAHIRRYDPWVNLVQRIVESVLFFHPAVWWVSRRIRDEREHCCDDAVIEAGGEPLDYARTLLAIAESARHTGTARAAFLSSPATLSSDGGSLKSRILRLAGAPAHEQTRLRRTWPVALALAAMLMTGGVAVFYGCGQDAPEPNRAATIVRPVDAPEATAAVTRRDLNVIETILLVDRDDTPPGLIVGRPPYVTNEEPDPRMFYRQTLEAVKDTGPEERHWPDLAARLEGTYHILGRLHVAEQFIEGRTITLRLRWVASNKLVTEADPVNAAAGVRLVNSAQLVFNKTVTLEDRTNGVPPPDRPSFQGASVYLKGRLPDSLPPGEYTVNVELDEYDLKDGLLVPAPKTKIRHFERLTAKYVVPEKPVEDGAADDKRLDDLARSKAFLDLVRRAVAMKSAAGQLGGRTNPTGLDFGPILERTGQGELIEDFPHDAREEAVRKLAEDRRLWALTALLNHDNVDVKIWTARALRDLADPLSTPALLAAAKANSNAVEGSEGATLHMTYCNNLKQALEKTTKLDLSPRGDRESEAVDLEKVGQWLKQKYLDDDEARATDPLPDRLIGALPPGWSMTHRGEAEAPWRWSGRTKAVTLSFRHDTLKQPFPPGPAAFTLFITPADYMGRLMDTNLIQPGGIGLNWVSDSWLVFGSLPQVDATGAAAFETLMNSLGFHKTNRHDITPRAAKAARRVTALDDADRGKPLPGSGPGTLVESLSPDALGMLSHVSIGKALDDPLTIPNGHGATLVSQWVRFGESFLGEADIRMRQPINYSYDPATERPVLKGESVIWVVRRINPDAFAAKIVADTPDNREAIRKATAYGALAPEDLIDPIVGRFDPETRLKDVGFKHDDLARRASAWRWFTWKTRGDEGRAAREALARRIGGVLARQEAAVRDDARRSLHDYAVLAGLLPELGAHDVIVARIENLPQVDCCYGPALFEGLASFDRKEDIPVLLDALQRLSDKGEEAKGTISKALSKLVLGPGKGERLVASPAQWRKIVELNERFNDKDLRFAVTHVPALLRDGKPEKIDGSLMVYGGQMVTWRWLFWRAPDAAPKPIDDDRDWMGPTVDELSASRDGTMLAVAYHGGDPGVMDVIDLPALLDAGKYKALHHINAYPGSVELGGWIHYGEGHLLVKSDVLLSKRGKDGRVPRALQLFKYSRFMVNPKTWSIEPYTDEDKNYIGHWIALLNDPEQYKRDGALKALEALDEPNVLSRLREALETEKAEPRKPALRRAIEALEK